MESGARNCPIITGQISAKLPRGLIAHHYGEYEVLQEHNVPHLDQEWGVRAHTLGKVAGKGLSFYPSLYHERARMYLGGSERLMSLVHFDEVSPERAAAEGSILFEILFANNTKKRFVPKCLIMGTLLEHRIRGTLGFAVFSAKKNVLWQVMPLQAVFSAQLHEDSLYVGVVGEK